MGSKNAFILLSPSSVEVLVVARDGTTRRGVRALDTEDWAEAWNLELRSFDIPLMEAMTDAGLGHKSSVTVIYRGPETRADVVLTPATGDDSLRAARLAFEDTASLGSGAFVRDETIRAESESGTQVLCVADTDAAAEAVVEWVGRAGPRVSALIPASAVLLDAALERAETTKKTVASVWLGRHSMLIVGSEDGEIKFARVIELGWQLLVEAANSSFAAQGNVVGTGAIAEALIAQGIPTRSDTWPIAGGIGGATLLPALQPVIQRYAVEIRQTTRFGFGAQKAARTKIEVCGEGAQIRNIDTMLLNQLELDVFRDSEHVETLSERTQAGRIPALGYLPSTVREKSKKRGISNAMRIGSAAAILTLAVDGGMTWVESQRLSEQTDDALHLLQEARATDERFTKATSLGRWVHGAHRGFQEVSGSDAPWSLAFAELAMHTPEQIRLSSLKLPERIDGYRLRVEGFAFGDEDSGPQLLASYVRDLGASRSITDVRLGSTRMSALDGQTAVSFELEFDLVVLPWDLLGLLASGAEETEGEVLP